MARTTVTLDPDVEALVKDAMREKGIGFKEAVNEAVRAGLSKKPTKKFRQRTYSMGQPTINLDKALQIAAAMEDEAIIRKIWCQMAIWQPSPLNTAPAFALSTETSPGSQA